MAEILRSVKSDRKNITGVLKKSYEEKGRDDAEEEPTRGHRHRFVGAFTLLQDPDWQVSPQAANFSQKVPFRVNKASCYQTSTVDIIAAPQEKGLARATVLLRFEGIHSQIWHLLEEHLVLGSFLADAQSLSELPA